MLRLLLLPFTIARRFLWMVVWHGVYFLLKRPKLFMLSAALLLAGIIYSGWVAYMNVDLLTQETGKTLPQSVAQAKDIPAVGGKIEDGNSAFATNLLSRMQPFEKQAYAKAFNGTMSGTAAGKENRWQANDDAYGSITPGDVFKSGYGASCRRFSELMSVRGINQKFTGISCIRKNGSWCKLRPNSAAVCDLKGEEGWGLWWHNKKIKINRMLSF